MDKIHSASIYLSCNILFSSDLFKCPFTGKEMLKMTQEDFYSELNKTFQSGFEERTANE